jgi:glycosyltransferase involved in cell wall biosynthesis
VDREYFREQVHPLLDHPLVEYIGEIGDAEKADFLGGARALLFPIDWPEPFGLVLVEAMACGTPVIAWRCGSVPEVVDHGVSGLIVGDEDEAVAAVREINALDRSQVRATFDRRFSASTMAKNYVELYRRLPAHDQDGTSYPKVA